MKKYSLKELEETNEWEEAVVVFTKDSFDKDYSEAERSYAISHDANWFDADKISFSLYGDCLDGKDSGVRLDWYMRALPKDGIGKRWIVDYCYITK